MEKPARVADMDVSTADSGGALRRALVFAVNFIKHPKMVGTFAVSSPALVQRLLADVDWSRCRAVVELGPGVGTITRAILQAMPAGARLVAVEMNADFVEELQRSLPDPRLDLVRGSAADLRAHLAEAALPAVDLAVSGIPFSTMPPAVRDQTLDAVAAALAPDGRFLVYQYARHVLPHLQVRFARVEVELEWRNLVPVRLFRCSQPRCDRAQAAETERVSTRP
jgi:phosphatidylethanolamine/phosphatidyl-N-methylethanolamine N-methyltransferase